MLELWDGTRNNDKQSITHTNLHKTKQQVGQCIVGAFLVPGHAMGKLKLTRLTTTQTWGKSAPSPL